MIRFVPKAKQFKNAFQSMKEEESLSSPKEENLEKVKKTKSHLTYRANEVKREMA